MCRLRVLVVDAAGPSSKYCHKGEGDREACWWWLPSTSLRRYGVDWCYAEGESESGEVVTAGFVPLVQPYWLPKLSSALTHTAAKVNNYGTFSLEVAQAAEGNSLGVVTYLVYVARVESRCVLSAVDSVCNWGDMLLVWDNPGLVGSMVQPQRTWMPTGGSPSCRLRRMWRRVCRKKSALSLLWICFFPIFLHFFIPLFNFKLGPFVLLLRFYWFSYKVASETYKVG